MSKPEVLQVGPYPEWDQRPLDAAFAMHRHEVGKRLAGFDMEVAYCDLAAKEYAPGWQFVPDPVALADGVEFLLVTLAASAETRHIVQREVIAAIGLGVRDNLTAHIAGQDLLTPAL